jgi:hypothetical protein
MDDIISVYITWPKSYDVMCTKSLLRGEEVQFQTLASCPSHFTLMERATKWQKSFHQVWNRCRIRAIQSLHRLIYPNIMPRFPYSHKKSPGVCIRAFCLESNGDLIQTISSLLTETSSFHTSRIYSTEWSPGLSKIFWIDRYSKHSLPACSLATILPELLEQKQTPWL